MKTIPLILLALMVVAFSACKTINNRESALESKRMEMEAIAAKYADINLYGPMDWTAFNAAFKEDAVVERLDMAKYEACLSGMVGYSNNYVLKSRESGCEELSKQGRMYSGKEHFEFVDRNKESYARCDSLWKALTLGFEKAFEPCREMLGSGATESTAPSSGGKKGQ